MILLGYQIKSVSLINKMKANLFNRLVYFDHNVLDQMTKGDPQDIISLFEDTPCIATYSRENLSEIKRSKGYEDTFIEVLRKIKAKYIVPNLDSKFRYTGAAQIHDGDPVEIYNSYVKEIDEQPQFDYEITGVVRKMYGGLEEYSYTELLTKSLDKIKGLIQIPDKTIDELDMNASEKENLKGYFRVIPEILKSSHSRLGGILDNNSAENSVKGFEQNTGINPKVLNNISGPNSLINVWAFIEKVFQNENLTLEKFFGLDQSEWSGDPERELSVIEKVNAIYNQLNYIGYFRDSDMKKDDRFTASNSDMTHAGMATLCQFFICRDRALVKKTEAAYEYLGLPTKIIHIAK